MSRNWVYDYLVSCPSLILLGEYVYRNTHGYVLLTISYPRLNILGRDNEELIVSKVPRYFLGDIVEKTCLCISRGVDCSNKSFLENAVYKTMFYGGYVVYLNREGEAVPLTIELVNTEKYRFYFKQVDSSEQTKSSLETWIILGMSLRTGFEEYLWSVCREIGSLSEEKCVIRTYGGELLITTRSIDLKGYFRVVPDNNPARHVINYEKMKTMEKNL